MSQIRQRVVYAVAWGIFALLLFLWRAPDYDYFAGNLELDHAYQAALGQQVLRGAIPGLDYFTQYGPAIGWSSALSWRTGHVWFAEVVSWSIFLAGGYGLLWWWVGGDQMPLRKMAVMLPAFLFTPFFAKYYFVFFPALFLVILGDGPSGTGGSKRSLRWSTAGLVAGLAGLFRIELGAALTFAGFIYVGSAEIRQRQWPHSASQLAGAATVVAAGYLGFLAVTAQNLSAPLDFLDFQRAVILGKVDAFSRNEAGLHGVFQRNAAGFWSLVGLGVFYVAGTVAGFVKSWRERLPIRIWAAALVGCALLPQLLHNTGVGYALQIGMPACGIAAVLCLQRWSRAGRWALWPLAFYSAAGLALVAGRANYGYVSWSDSVVSKLRSLHDETRRQPDLSGLDELANAIDRIAEPRASIVVPSLDAKIYALSRRRWAGLIPHYAIPLPLRWQQRCVEALKRDKPSVLVIRLQIGNRFEFRGRNPLFDQFVRENYIVADRSIKGWLLLTPSIAAPERNAKP